MNRLLRFILDREPVAAATGLAGGVSVLIGVLAAWEVWRPTPEQMAAIGALVAWVAGWAARSRAYAPATVEHYPEVVTANGSDDHDHG